MNLREFQLKNAVANWRKGSGKLEEGSRTNMKCESQRNPIEKCSGKLEEGSGKLEEGRKAAPQLHPVHFCEFCH